MVVPSGNAAERSRKLSGALGSTVVAPRLLERQNSRESGWRESNPHNQLGRWAAGGQRCKQGNPTAAQTSTLARRVARELKAAGWRLERVLADNGNEFRCQRFHHTTKRLGANVTHIHAGRPQTNGHVEALHKTILEECWRPAFARYLHPRYTSLKRELDRYLVYYNTNRVHHGRLTRGRIPADIVYAANKMKTAR